MILDDVKTIVDNIEDFIELPGGIDQIQAAVFTLAISGKLVEQDPAEGRVEDLEVMLLKFKKSKTLKILISDEYSGIATPSTWLQSRLGAACIVTKGKKPILFDSMADGRFPYLEARYLRGTASPKFADFSDKNSVFVSDKDLSIICDGSNSGEIFYGKAGILSSTMGIIRFDEQIIKNEFLQIFLKAKFKQLNDEKKGAAIPHLDFEVFNNLLLPIPPLAEQARIAQRVNEIMVQLDELRAKKCERDDSRNRLTRNAMYALGLGNADIALKNLEELVKTSSDLRELEKGVLTLAISGKLSPQNFQDKNAEDLYLDIQNARTKVVSGKMRTKIMASINTKEIPFEIPDSWKWVRLGEVGEVATGKTPRTGITENYNGNIPFIGPGDIKFGKIVSHSKLVTATGASESEYARRGDIIMVCIGGTIGKTALVERDTTFNQQINKISPILVNSEYLYYVLISGYFLKTVLEKKTGGATPILNLSRWSTCLIPLPPLAEQERIVEKTKMIMKRMKQLQSLFARSSK